MRYFVVSQHEAAATKQMHTRGCRKVRDGLWMSPNGVHSIAFLVRAESLLGLQPMAPVYLLPDHAMHPEWLHIDRLMIQRRLKRQELV